MVRTPCFAVAQIQFLVREPRSHKLHSMAKKKKKEEEEEENKCRSKDQNLCS